MRSVSAALAIALAMCGLAPATARGLPAGREPAAVSAVSSSDWWLLAQSDACPTATCNQTLLKTTNGGRSFVAAGSLPIADPVALHAVDDEDLFVSSANGRLWISTNGGLSWRAANPVGQNGRSLFVGLPQVAGGYAYAVAWVGSGTRLLRAPLGALAADRDPRAAWKSLPAPPGKTMGLMARGSNVLALSQPSSPAFPAIYTSADYGRSFRATGAKLPVIGCSFDPTGAAIWADCGTGMLVGIWRSTDDGNNFTPAGSDAYTNAAPFHPVIAGTSGAIFAALSASTAVIGLHPLYRTTNGGFSYQRVAGSPAGVDDWKQFDVVRPGYALALGTFTVNGGTGANPRFAYRLFAVTGLGTHYRQIQIR